MISRLCIVPARAGSKRFPGKNKAFLAGKPLILHTLETVVPLFDTVVFTSDSHEMLSLASSVPGLLTLERPPALASDTSKVAETVLWLQQVLPRSDQIWLCLPTCPLRSADDILAAQTLLDGDPSANSVVSVIAFEFPPTLALELHGSELREHDPSRPFASGNTRSQDHQVLLRPNGALYGARWESFAAYKTFFGGRVLGLPMPRERSVDIDSPLDLLVAETLIRP
jgi:CMP-N-acetylneuraminic acid synthetase